MMNFKIILTIIISSISLYIYSQENSISPIFSLSESSNSFSNTFVSLNQISGDALEIESFAIENYIGKNFTVSTLESSNMDKLYIINDNNNLSVYDIPYFFDPNYSGEQTGIVVANNITDIDYNHNSSSFYSYDLLSNNLYNMSLYNATILSSQNIAFSSENNKFSIKTTNEYVVLKGNTNDSITIGFLNMASNNYNEINLTNLYKEFNIVSNYNLDIIYAIAKDINDVNYLIEINPENQSVQVISEILSCIDCASEILSYDKNGLAIDWENNQLISILTKTVNSEENYYLVSFDLSNGEVIYLASLKDKTSNLYFNKASADLVFPGDANHDGRVNGLDLFPIGLKYSFNTIARFTQNTDWIGQHSFNMGINIQGVDVKHADCNGDGQINTIDMEAISKNYTYIHNSDKSSSATDSDCDYPLSFSFTSSLYQNSTAQINIKLGDASDIVYDVYGVSFTVYYDNTYVVPNTMHTEPISTWFGTQDVNFIQTDVDNYTAGSIEISLVGVDLLNRTGGGDIVTLAWTIEDWIMPIAQPFENMNLRIDDITIINYNEDVLDACGVDTNVLIYEEIVSIKTIDNDIINIYPNPTKLVLNIDTDIDIDVIELFSLEGKKVLNSLKKTIDVSKISRGVYFIKLYTNEGVYVDKIVVK